MITTERLRESLTPDGEEGMLTLTLGIFVLTLFLSEFYGIGDQRCRLTARLNLDAYSEREGPVLIDINGTEEGVLEVAAKILNFWETSEIRGWADGLEELHRPKKGTRSALSRLVED